jgi:hypothetical protein
MFSIQDIFVMEHACHAAPLALPECPPVQSVSKPLPSCRAMF